MDTVIRTGKTRKPVIIPNFMMANKVTLYWYTLLCVSSKTRITFTLQFNLHEVQNAYLEGHVRGQPLKLHISWITLMLWFKQVTIYGHLLAKIESFQKH